jgi:hypothetical protein
MEYYLQNFTYFIVIPEFQCQSFSELHTILSLDSFVQIPLLSLLRFPFAAFWRRWLRGASVASCV